MKNLHVLQTDKPSRLHLWTDENGTRLELCELEYSHTRNTQNIYITNDEEIKDKMWVWDKINNRITFIISTRKDSYNKNVNLNETYSKIILTDNKDLIKDGVQAIDDEFLEWFVKNPSCESVETKLVEFEVDMGLGDSCIEYGSYYKIIIPKEDFDDYHYKETFESRQYYVPKEVPKQEKERGITITHKDEQKQHLIDMMKGDEELGLYDESREIKFEDVFSDEKREKVKRVIHQHKVLKDLSLVNPAHLQMTSNGHGEFPDGYKLTEKGIQYIIEQLNKE
jgi:hypothetical protein